MMIPYQQIHETLRFLIHIRENDLAVSLAEKIYNLDPSSILSKETYSKTLLFARKRLDQAEKIAAELSLNDPDNLELLYHWSQCLHRNYKTKKALTIIEKVLTLNPHHFEARLERSLFHFFSGNYDTVLEELEKLHNERPEDERIINTLGWFLIHHGDFLNGIRLYRRGRKIGNWGEPRYEHLSGIELPSVLTEKKVLWLGEAGQGDQMINARFIPLFADRGAQVDIFCHPQLKDIFSRIRGIQKIFLNQNQMNFSDYDYVIPAMDSPLALCLDESNLDQGSYFVPTKEKIIEWKNLLGKKNKFRIGLRWQGNIECEPDMQRTIPIEDLLNLLNHSQFSEVEFYSFQTDQSVDTINTHLNIKEIKKTY